MENVIFYGFQFAHHGKHTGFNPLKKELTNYNINAITAIRPQIFSKRGFRRLKILRKWMKLQECRIYRYYMSNRPHIMHYFFPENSLFFAPRWKGVHKLVITCHQPVQEGHFERLEKKNPYFLQGIKSADVIILMASCDIQAFREFAPQAEVICIPHGVDTNYFSRNKTHIPFEGRDNCNHVLTIGNWLRDYGFWVDVVKEILSKNKSIIFTVIAGHEVQTEIKKRFNGMIPEGIRLVSGIADDELRNIYAKADLMFLPLVNSWANNALLESASMGLPIMVTDLPAVREYLNDQPAFFFRNDNPKDISLQLQSLINNDTLLTNAGKALRMHAKNELSWESIAKRHIELYYKLLVD